MPNYNSYNSKSPTKRFINRDSSFSPAAAISGEKTEVTGVIHRVIFYNNNFAILSILANDGTKPTIKGTITQDQLDELVRTREVATFQGKIETHAKYGSQLKFSTFFKQSSAVILDINAATMSNFIAANLRGVGQVKANEIIINCGGADKVAAILDSNHPAELANYHKTLLTPSDAIDLSNVWKSEKAKLTTISFFADHGITSSFVPKFYEKYGASAIAVITANPYILIKQFEGIGFKRADEIALKLGMQLEDPKRIKAAISFQLEELCASNGSVFADASALILETRKLLSISSLLVRDQLESLKRTPDFLDQPANQRIGDTEDSRDLNSGASDSAHGDGSDDLFILIEDEDRLYLPAYYRVENNIASYISSMLQDEGEEEGEN